MKGKLIQQSLAKTSQMLKTSLVLLLWKSCLIVTVWYLCSNRSVKQLTKQQWNNRFFLSLEVAISLSWPFISLQKCECKIVSYVLHSFTQLNLIGEKAGNSKTMLLKLNYAYSEKESIE